jgi:hypothetical protein
VLATFSVASTRSTQVEINLHLLTHPGADPVFQVSHDR